MTTASWPCRVSCSQTRRTELVTPLTCGRKDSLTIATRTRAACPRPGALRPDHGWRPAEPVANCRRPAETALPERPGRPPAVGRDPAAPLGRRSFDEQGHELADRPAVQPLPLRPHDP